MSFVLMEQKEKVAWITINRPEALNSMNSEVLTELLEKLNLVEENSDILCAVITGAGDKAFSAGGDIKEEIELTSETARKFYELGHNICKKIQKLRVPVIAAVNGYALGGGLEFALACDIIIACDKAKFGLPSVKLGIVSGFGGTQNLARIVGKSRAKEILITSRIFGAEEALKLGIVQEVVPKEDFINHVINLSNSIAAMPPYAVRTTKNLVNVGADFDIDTAYEIETELGLKCYDTEDKYEAMAAFIEKRAPKKFINR